MNGPHSDEMRDVYSELAAAMIDLNSIKATVIGRVNGSTREELLSDIQCLKQHLTSIMEED